MFVSGDGFGTGFLLLTFGYTVMSCLGYSRCNIGFPLNMKVDERISYIDKGMYYAHGPEGTGQEVRVATTSCVMQKDTYTVWREFISKLTAAVFLLLRKSVCPKQTDRRTDVYITPWSFFHVIAFSFFCL